MGILAKAMNRLAVNAALAVGLGAGSVHAAMMHSVAVVDTRADVLAEILPGSCTYELAEDSTLTVTFGEDLIGVQYVLPDDLGPLVFNVNGKTITGVAGADGGISENGGDGSPAFTVGSGTTIMIAGTSGSITGGAGGRGKQGGSGAYAFADSSGNEFVVSGETALVAKGSDGPSAVAVSDVSVTAIEVGDENAALTVLMSFASEITAEAFVAWAKDHLKVKVSESPAGLDDATPRSFQLTDIPTVSKDGTMVTVRATVPRPSADSGFFHAIVVE